MKELNVGDVFEFDYPFYNQVITLCDNIKQTWLTPGCHKFEEFDDVFYNPTYIANYVGKIVFEVLSVASMPERYMDRVVVKRYYLQPDGSKFSAGEVKMLTVGKLNSYIESENVFPVDYEVEESCQG